MCAIYSFLKSIACLVTRLMLVASGFHYVPVKGKQLTRKEAPIFILAPHSSFFDALPAVVLGAPSIVSGIENRSIPLIGSRLNFNNEISLLLLYLFHLFHLYSITYTFPYPIGHRSKRKLFSRCFYNSNLSKLFKNTYHEIFFINYIEYTLF